MSSTPLNIDPLRLPRALTPDELDALRAVPMNLRDRALIEVMCSCGLRVSEACNLTLDDIRWSTDTPSLRFIGKKGRERVVPMNLKVQDAMRRWLEYRGIGGSPYVFCALRTGERLSRKTVWDALCRYAQKAGIRHVHPHMLRHTFGTALADREVPVERIRELMGHASIVTSQVYIAVSTEQKRTAVDRIDLRSRFFRWLSRQRNRDYRFWGRPRKGLAFSRKQTVGRHAEVRQLQGNVDKGVDTLLIGPVGVGKSHLLSLVEGERIIRMDSLSPIRQAVIAIAEELHRRGAFGVDQNRLAPVCLPLPGGQTGGGQTGTGRQRRQDAKKETGEGQGGLAPSVPLRENDVDPDAGENGSRAHLRGEERASGPAGEQSQAQVSGEGLEPEAAPAGDLSVCEYAQADAPGSITSFDEIRKQHTRTGVQGWLDMVLSSVEENAWTLVVDDLSGLSPSTGRLLERLSRKFTVVGALPEVRRGQERHFWKFDRLEVGPLPTEDARRLIRQCAAGAEIEDIELFETHVMQQSGGNPRAIVELVERLRKEGVVTRTAVREVGHSGARQQIDLTPGLVIIACGLVAARFIARGMGSVDGYVIAGVGSALAMGVRFFLYRFRK